MGRYWYERLSAMDASFLFFESENTHMHVAGTAIFDAAPFRRPDGGVDIERIRKYIASRLHLIPRYRQRLLWIPVFQHPVWVDDDRFSLEYHVRHTALPRPGDESQLKLLSGRIMSQQLDRGKPLWESWIVEGLEGDRFALITKAHHCMIDGIAGVDLLSVLLTSEPHDVIDEPPAWVPRPAPSPSDLLREEMLRRATLPARLVRAAAGRLQRPDEAVDTVRNAIRAAVETLWTGLHSAEPTPLNVPIGPHRRFDWLDMDLGELKQIKNRLGCTLNDVVLAIVSGAVQRFLEHRWVNPEIVDFRVLVPVSVRRPEERGRLGNRVSAWFVDLPVGEQDPRRRAQRIAEQTSTLKQTHMALGAETLTGLADWMGTTILQLGVQLAARSVPFNMVVTNVPGPQVPFYMMQAPLLAVYPQVPLFHRQALGVALLSYNGRLCWGFNADWDQMGDLPRFTGAVRDSLAELSHASRPIELRQSVQESRTPPSRRPASAAQARRRRAESGARGKPPAQRGPA